MQNCFKILVFGGTAQRYSHKEIYARRRGSKEVEFTPKLKMAGRGKCFQWPPASAAARPPSPGGAPRARAAVGRKRGRGGHNGGRAMVHHSAQYISEPVSRYLTVFLSRYLHIPTDLSATITKIIPTHSAEIVMRYLPAGIQY